MMHRAIIYPILTEPPSATTSTAIPDQFPTSPPDVIRRVVVATALYLTALTFDPSPIPNPAPDDTTNNVTKWEQPQTQPDRSRVGGYRVARAPAFFFDSDPIPQAAQVGGGGMPSPQRAHVQFNVVGAGMSWQYQGLTQPVLVLTSTPSEETDKNADKWLPKDQPPLDYDLDPVTTWYFAPEADFTPTLDSWLSLDQSIPWVQKKAALFQNIEPVNFTPLAEPMPDTWWQPASERIHAAPPRLQGESVIDPTILLAAETIYLSAYFQQASEPVRLPPRVAEFPSAISPDAFLQGTEDVTMDKWWQPTSTPRRGRPSVSYAFQWFEIDPTAVWQLNVDRWWRETERPVWAKPNWNYLYPSFTMDADIAHVPVSYKLDVSLTDSSVTPIAFTEGAVLKIRFTEKTRDDL